jgi:hypothetical protein
MHPAWYLDNDPITSIARFKEEPSINKELLRRRAKWGRTEAKDDFISRRDYHFLPQSL